MRHGKGTYWLCIGKNKYRKLYTGDWFKNKKEGKGIFFFNDGGCYDGSWKNSKRDGKGLMIYANGDTYEGSWENDLKHGYGIIEYEFPEKKKGNKYYGYWCNDLKEGQGYYYYSDIGKIFLGEWHEDSPRTGIYTNVEESKLHIYNLKNNKNNNNSQEKNNQDNENDEISYFHPSMNDPTPSIRVLKLNEPDKILEESIRHVHFIRFIKLTINKNFSELYAPNYQRILIDIFKNKYSLNNNIDNKNSNIKSNKAKILSNKQLSNDELDNNLKSPNFTISVYDFKNMFKVLYNFDIPDETLELILSIFKYVSLEKPYDEKLKIDFLMFTKLYYLVLIKYSINDYNSNSELIKTNNLNNKSKSIIDDNLEDNYSYIDNKISDTNNNVFNLKSNKNLSNISHSNDEKQVYNDKQNKSNKNNLYIKNTDDEVIYKDNLNSLIDENNEYYDEDNENYLEENEYEENLDYSNEEYDNSNYNES